MKKNFIFLSFLLTAFLSGCGENAIDPGISSAFNGNIQVFLDQYASGGAKDIFIGSSLVTNADIRLTGPSGESLATNWSPGDPTVIIFNAGTTGTYSFSLVQSDTSNQSYTTNFSFDFVSGYNYYINVSLGGYMTVTLREN